MRVLSFLEIYKITTMLYDEGINYSFDISLYQINLFLKDNVIAIRQMDKENKLELYELLEDQKIGLTAEEVFERVLKKIKGSKIDNEK